MFFKRYALDANRLGKVLLSSAHHSAQLIRDGKHSVANLMSIGKSILGRRLVLPSVLSSLTFLQVEGTFPSGTAQVTVYDPISSEDGDLEKALHGSFLPIPSKEVFPPADLAAYEAERQPGAVVPVKEGRIVINEGRTRIRMRVTNKGDRAVNVGSIITQPWESYKDVN